MGDSPSLEDQGNIEAIADKMLRSSPRVMERVGKIIREHGLEGHKLSTRVEWVQCGKKCKRCPHGPYLYVYWKQGGKTRSKYIGKPGK